MTGLSRRRSRVRVPSLPLKTSSAARLTSSAADGQIVVDAETYADVAPAYPDARQERLMLKGKREPVEAYWIPP